MEKMYNKICRLIGKFEIATEQYNKIKNRIWIDKYGDKHIIFGDMGDEYAAIIFNSYYLRSCILNSRVDSVFKFKIRFKLPSNFSIITIASIIFEEFYSNEYTVENMAMVLSTLIAIIDQHGHFKE